MRRTKIKSVAIIAAACLLSISNIVNAESTNTGNTSAMTAACDSSATQKVTFANKLGNDQIPHASTDPYRGMTGTAVNVIFYDTSGAKCWDKNPTLMYNGTLDGYAGPSCACKQKIARADIIPIARIGYAGYPPDPKAAYSMKSIDINTGVYYTTVTIIQGQAPIFDTQSGFISNQGAMTNTVSTYSK